MALETLPDELLIDVCAHLTEQTDLRHLALAGQRRFTDASAVELYRHPIVGDSKAAKLVRTLRERPQLGCYVKAIDYTIGESLNGDMPDEDQRTEFETFDLANEGFSLMPNVTALRYDTQMAPMLAYDWMTKGLRQLKRVRRAVLIGTPNTMPLNQFSSVLDVWRDTLESLELYGATTWPCFGSTFALPTMPRLADLRLYYPRLQDNNFVLLCQSARLHTLSIVLGSEKDAFADGTEDRGPSDESILAILEAHSDTLRDLTIHRGWTGHEGGDWRFGRAVLERCPRLEKLELHGEITSNSMLVYGANSVEALDLCFVSTLTYESVLWSLKTGRWPALKQLSVHHMGYEEDYEQETVEQLICWAKLNSIAIDAGACLGCDLGLQLPYCTSYSTLPALSMPLNQRLRPHSKLSSSHPSRLQVDAGLLLLNGPSLLD